MNILKVIDADIDKANWERVTRTQYADRGKQVVRQEDLGQMGSASYRSIVSRRSSSNHGSSPCSSSKLSELVVVVIQLLFLSTFCRGDLLGHMFVHGPEAERAAGRSMISIAASIPNYCTKFYSAVKGETCASLRKSSQLSQVQLFEINQGLDCTTISEGQAICVQGISAHCATTISVTKGQTSPTCASIAGGSLTTEGFLILNPGISCPEAPGNNNAWPSSHPVCVSPGLNNLFTEYIGASGLPITFGDVQPLYAKYSSVIYHVILAFAIDVDAKGVRTNGVYYPYWNPSLTPAAAKAFKAANPNIRLLMSLGGATKYVNSSYTVNVVWEDPPNTTEWVDTAQASLTAIANQYSIDGIDIDYKSFPKGSVSFAYCIGTLVKRLKGTNTIGLATIAPFGAVMPEYMSIMYDYGDQIDYVNFQFYAYQLPTVNSYVSQYNAIASYFPPWKLLASTSINGTNSITGLPFLKAVNEIQSVRGLPGVMLYDADHSVAENFQDEKLVLALLNGEPYTNITNSTTPGGPAPAPSPSLGLSPGPGPILTPGSSPLPGALTPGSPYSSPAPGFAPKSSLAPSPTPGAPLSSLAPDLAPKSSLAPAPTPGAPHSSLAPSPAPKSSLAPGLGPGAPHSSLAPGLAPKSSLAPALTPGAPQSSLAPGSSSAPAGSNQSHTPPAVPAPSSAPKRFLGRRWSSGQGFGLLTTVFVLLFAF